MEPEEHDAINEPRPPQHSRRAIIERIIWSSSNEVRNHIEISINNIDDRLQQTTSIGNYVIDNERSEEMPEFLSRNLIRHLVTASYHQSEIRRYNFWTRRFPGENSDDTVTGIEANTYLTPPSSLNQVVPCDTNQDSVPIRVTGLTGRSENGHNQNVSLRLEPYIEQTNVNLSVDCQKRKPKSKRRKYIKVCQNHQDCMSRRVSEATYILNSCHEMTELENSSSTEQLTTQGFQCQNACLSTSLVNVPKPGELEIHLPQNQEAKLPVPSTSMQKCNKERSESSEKQNNPNSSPMNSEVPSTSTGMSSTTAYNTYPECNSNFQSPFPKFSSFNNRNMTIEQNFSKPEVLQFLNTPITSCSSNISLQVNPYNDNSSVCLKNTDNKHSVTKVKATGVPHKAFCSSALMNTRKKFAAYINENECSSSLTKPEKNIKYRKYNRIISENNRLDLSAEKEYILLLGKAKNILQSRLSATNIENPHLSSPCVSHELRDYSKDSASNVSTATCTSPLYKPSELENQRPLHFNEEPHLTTFASKIELISTVDAVKEKIRHLKGINERWEIKKDEVMHATPFKVSSSANVFEKQKIYFHNIQDGGMDRSGTNSCKIKYQGTSGDTENPNPEVNGSDALRKIRLLKSCEESSSKNEPINDRKFNRESIQGKSSVTLKQMEHDYPQSETSNEQLMNDNPISETHFPIVQPGRSAKFIEKNTYSLHDNTLNNPLHPFNRDNELISNKPISLRKMTEMEIHNESISKNSQKEGENSLNPLQLNVVSSDIQRAEPILVETCSTNDNNDECVDTSGSLKPNTEYSTTSISYMKLSKDSSPTSRLVETNQDTYMAETYQKDQMENSPMSNFASDSVSSTASNNKTAFLKASMDKSEFSESFSDKANELTSIKLNSDKQNSVDVQSLNGDCDEQVKENIPPDDSLPN